MKNLQTIDTFLGILADLLVPLVAERFEQTSNSAPPAEYDPTRRRVAFANACNWCFDDCATV